MYVYIHIYTYIYIYMYTESAHISMKQIEHSIYVVMKTMCSPCYHQNGFAATLALGQMMYIM